MPVIQLPTFHGGQVNIFRARAPRNVVRCGRRFGKTKMMVTLAGDAATKGKKVGIFTPEYKQLTEPFDELEDVLQPIKRASNRSDGFIKTKTKGKIDFWRLIDNELAGRGREYDLVLVDEAAFTKNVQMTDIWNKSIVPTMATKPNAQVWVFSTPKGVDQDNFFWQVCNDPIHEFKEHHAPSWINPLVNASWVETERGRLHPDVFRQEIAAEFVDWTGVSFFALASMLADGAALAAPRLCDTVYAVIDTAVKTGQDNDGTAVIYFARSSLIGAPLVVLDWDIIQIEGALLETWLPTVLERCEGLARETGARYGSAGAWIEDKASGMVLLQQAARRDLPATPIPAPLTALGKDERAISVSGYVYQGQVKLSEHAYNKTSVYKGASRNHFLSQVTGFRLGDKDAAKRADDLLDCFTYGVALSLGNADGY